MLGGRGRERKGAGGRELGDRKNGRETAGGRRKGTGGIREGGPGRRRALKGYAML